MLQNRSTNKSIRIFLAALFFAMGVGTFSLTAEAAFDPNYYKYEDLTLSTKYEYLLPTTEEALTPENKTAYSALSSYQKIVVNSAVIDHLKNIVPEVVTLVNKWKDKWNAAMKGLIVWKFYDPVHNAYPPNETYYDSNDNLVRALTTFPTYDAAASAEYEARYILDEADQAYVDAINDAVTASITELKNKEAKKQQEIDTAEAKKVFDDCITAAGGDKGKEELCDTEKQKRLGEIKTLSGGSTELAGETKTGAGQKEVDVAAVLTKEKDTKAAYLIMSTYIDCIENTDTEVEKTACENKKTSDLTKAGISSAVADAIQADLTAGTESKEARATRQLEVARNALANEEISSPEEDALFNAVKKACWPLTGEGIIACFAQIPYWFVYKPSSWLLIIAGYMFDASLALSIDKEFVNQPFIDSSWTVIRDFSNMLFIFILLYTGIQTILGLGDWRKTVLHIVIIALLINFSLFFTKVVIDAGNILAVGIFQSMGATKAAGTKVLGKGSVPERNLSESLVANLQPQQFLMKAGKVDGMNAVIVFIVAAIVNVAVAYVLFKVALLFIGRLLAFWVLMIFSPFALISFTMKGKANIFGWWTSTLISQSFVAPVFLFLLYLVMTVISAGDSGIMGAFSK